MKYNEIKFWLTNLRWLSPDKTKEMIAVLNSQHLTSYKAFRDQRLAGMI